MESTKIKKFQILGLDLNTVLLSTLYIFSFLIPLLISKPQILVGSTINFLIVYTTLKYGFKKAIPILLIPSLVATGRGLLFGSATIFLVYLLPFIMISNGILSLSIIKIKGILGVVIGCVLKVIFLYLATYILVNTISLPSIFLTTMGISQLYTALIGSGVALILYLLTNKQY